MKNEVNFMKFSKSYAKRLVKKDVILKYHAADPSLYTLAFFNFSLYI